MGLVETAKGVWAGYKFKRSTLGRALAQHTHDFFHSGSALSHISQSNKDRLVQDFYSRVVGIGAADNPAMACREALAEYVL